LQTTVDENTKLFKVPALFLAVVICVFPELGMSVISHFLEGSVWGGGVELSSNRPNLFLPCEIFPDTPLFASSPS